MVSVDLWLSVCRSANFLINSSSERSMTRLLCFLERGIGLEVSLRKGNWYVCFFGGGPRMDGWLGLCLYLSGRVKGLGLTLI